MSVELDQGQPLNTNTKQNIVLENILSHSFSSMRSTSFPVSEGIMFSQGQFFPNNSLENHISKNIIYQWRFFPQYTI